MRDVGERPLEGVEVLGARDLGPVRHPEDEVAEVEPVPHQVPDPAQQVPGALQEEIGPDAAGEGLVLGTAGVEDRRNVRPHLAHRRDEPLAGLRIGPAAPGELDVRDDPEDLVPVGGEVVPGLLVAVAEQDLGPPPDAVELFGEAQPFRDQFPRLFEHRLVRHRQERRVVADAVLDEQDGGNAQPAGVLRRVPAVLDLLHDREEDPDVPLPHEGLFEVLAVVPRQVLAHRAGVVAEERDRGLAPRVAEAVRERPDVHVPEVRRGDHELEAVGHPGDAFERLVAGLHLDHPGEGPQVQVEEPRQDPVVELAVLGEDERVVVAQHEEDIVDLEADEVREGR